MLNQANALERAIDRKIARAANARTRTAGVVNRVEKDGTVYVRVDGSDVDTPVSGATAAVSIGDAVSVRIENGRATIDGNWTRPATDDTTADAALIQAQTVQANLGQFERIVTGDLEAQRIRTGELEADTAKIHSLTADELSAATGYIADLTSENITAENIKSATGYVGDLQSKNITTGNIQAATGFVDTLGANNVTAQNIVADHGTVGSLGTHYAQIDAANVTDLTAVNAWLDKVMVQTGMIAHEGTVYTLDAIQVNAANITAGTIDVERLIVTVDGQKYMVHIDPSTSQPSYEKMDGNIIEPRTITADKIVAGAITANEITTENIVGTGGWINLRNGTFNYHNAANTAYISWDGQNLNIVGSNLNTTIAQMSETVKYGGKNLLLHTGVTAADKEWLKDNISSLWNNLTIETVDGESAYKYDPTWGPATWHSGAWCTLKADTYYTYSVDLHYTKDVPFNMNSLGHFQVYNAASEKTDKSHEDVSDKRVFAPDTIPANTWTRASVTFLTNGLDGSTFQIYPRFNIAANDGTLHFKNAKLELGTIATPWDYASEDVTTLTNTVNSVKQTLDGFKTTVSRTLAESARNMLDGTVSQEVSDLTWSVANQRANPHKLFSYQAGQGPITRTEHGVRIDYSGSGSTPGIVYPLIEDGCIAAGEQLNLSLAYRGNITSLKSIFFLNANTPNTSQSGFDAPLLSDGEWHTLSITWTATLGATEPVAFLIGYAVQSSGKWLEVRDGSAMLERGDISSRVSTAETAIEQNADGITLTAKKVESSTNMLADYNAPSLAAVNAKNARYFSDNSANRTGEVVEISDPPEPWIETGGRISTTGTSHTSSSAKSALVHYGYDGAYVTMTEGESYTFSFWARKVSGTCAFYCQVGSGPYINKDDSSAFQESNALGTGWTYIEFPFTYTAEKCGGTNGCRVYPGIVFKAGTAGVGEVCGAKVTRGSYATQAELKVANDNISSKVSSTDYTGATVASLINQSADTVKIEAEHIEIDGTATFNAIKSKTDAAYDAKNAASTAVGNLKTDLASSSGTTVIDGGHITTGSIAIGTLDSSTQTKITNGNTAKTTADNLVKTTSELGIKWNYSAFSTANDGECYLCKRDPYTGAFTDANGAVYFNGTKRTITKGMVNPNALALNRTIYVVCRLSSATATTGTNYLVWYDGSAWQYLDGINQAASGATTAAWTWAEATDIVLASFVMSAAEAPMMNQAQYDPPLTAAQVTKADSSYLKAATAQTTATNAAKTATNFITADSSGIKVHNTGDSSNYAHITSDGMDVRKGGTSVAMFGETARVGKAAGPRTVIQSSGVDLYGKADGSVQLAHFGYASGNTEGGTSVEPYYTFGRRKSGSGIGNWSVAEGYSVEASGYCSHAEGMYTTASWYRSHAEGDNTTASGGESHAEGAYTTASGVCSHAEGSWTKAIGEDSHAEGSYTIASGFGSHAAGRRTKASSDCQTVIGRDNVEDTAGTYALIIGNGTADNARKNALTVDWNGEVAAKNAHNAITAKISAELTLSNTYQNITLSSVVNVGSGFSIVSGGVKCAYAGTVEASAMAYINGLTDQDQANLNIAKGTTQMAHSTMRTSGVATQTMLQPILINVAAGDILYLQASNGNAARGKVPNYGTMTYMTVKYV